MVVGEVEDGFGQWRKANFFLDNGSNTSLVRSKFAESHQLLYCGDTQVGFDVAGGGTHLEIGALYKIKVRPLNDTSEGYGMFVTGIKKPCARVKPISPNLFSKHKHLEQHKHLLHTAGGEIDILVGGDYGPLIVSQQNISAEINPDHNPSISCTRLGCFVYGGLNQPPRRAMNNVVSVNYLNVTRKDATDQLRDFFYSDVIGVKPTSLCICSENEIAESAFIKHVQKTTRFNEEGRIEVSIPWRPGFPDALPNNFEATKALMFKREKQCKQDGTLELYNEMVQDLLTRKVVRTLSPDEASKAADQPGWYLNHFLVERPDKESTKHRLVFNSALPYSGVCLNDAVEKGPDYMNSIFHVILHFRTFEIAVTGDMQKMFNQISTCPADRKYHRFLWRFGDESSQITIFEWERVLFGDKPSPDLAGYAVRHLSELHKDKQPFGAAASRDSTYR